MWELQSALPFGRLSIRRTLLFVAALLVTVFAYIFLTAPTTYAADATWKGSSISYDNNQYIKVKDATQDDGLHIAPGAHVYSFTEAPVAGGSNTSSRKAHLIYFAPGVDPATADKADYVEYDFLPPNTYNNASHQKTISLDKQNAANQATTSCDSTYTLGIGWIVCPVTNFFSGAMDWLFSVLTGFLDVRPAQTNQDNALYRTWAMMRSIANVVFVISFIIIIYSQLTNMGISNYGIKKMLPRLIVAAVLVNISYWICALAIDASNILGYSLQDIFISMRNNIVGGTGNSWDVVSWKSIGGFILSGGTAIGAGLIGLHGLGIGVVGASLYLLLPILASALLAILVALLVLAARQAIITVMVILAPLAFVAYLLPNTEKYFGKWREVFMTMLLMFPIFSVLFGGAQLAGTAIIQNADSINAILLGMAVQVIPIAITPLLIKFSGALLGRFAGVINNPSKGMVDRTRKWAQERAGMYRDQVYGDPNARGLNRLSQNMYNKKRRREAWQKANQSSAENLLRSGEEYAAIDTAVRDAEREKKIIDQNFESTWNIRAKLDPSSLERELTMRVTADEAALAKNRLDNVYENIKAGDRALAHSIYGDQTDEEARVDLFNRAADGHTFLALEAMRKKAAEHTQEHHLTEALLHNNIVQDETGRTFTARDYAGGIRGHEGANTALATAVARDRKEYADQISEKSQLIKHFNLDSGQRQRLALGENVSASKGGVDYVFESTDDFAREAAIEAQLKTGSEGDIINIIRESGKRTLADGTVREGKTYNYRTTISDAIPANGIPGKALIFGSKVINDVYTGNFLGDESLNDAATYHILEGKIRDDVLSVQGTNTLQYLFEAKERFHESSAYKNAAPAARTELERKFNDNYLAMQQSAFKILRDNVNRNATKASTDIFQRYAAPVADAPLTPPEDSTAI